LESVNLPDNLQNFLDLAECGYPSYVDILPMWISFLCGYPSCLDVAKC